ncbi:MAG: sirohydrochlorin cobaltochelatase, partial [Ruminococcus sp.]|nr:sirohydrochlorin cobaltochelatase [Ruminococcus sp.]
MKKFLALLLAGAMAATMLAACGKKDEEKPAEESTPVESTVESGEESGEEPETPSEEEVNQQVADEMQAKIEAIQVQEATPDTMGMCESAKASWDMLSDEQKALVPDADYFDLDTGDASKDDPLNQDEIGENEILVVSFGTSFNDSRAEDIGGVEKAIQAANPDWSVRRAFTAQIIINHIYARDGVKIDNMDEAMQRAVDNGVKKLVIQPTHLMHGAEYDELVGVVENYKDKFDQVVIAEPLLGEVGAEATNINEDKKEVISFVVDEAAKSSSYENIDAAKEDGVALVLMGHGTSHTAKITYTQMQATVDFLGIDNVFIGTVEGEPEDTECSVIIEKVAEAGYKKVILRPL